MLRRRDRDEAIRQTRELTQQIERRLDKMETVLIIREPSSTVAADAYDGLRKQVVTALSERQAHVTQLVQFASAIEAGAELSTLTAMVRGWLESANVLTMADCRTTDADVLFQVVEDLGGPVEVLSPAYIDSTSGRVIRQGRIRRTAPEPSDSVAPPGPGSVTPVAAVDTAGMGDIGD
jgi:hypothetical protein